METKKVSAEGGEDDELSVVLIKPNEKHNQKFLQQSLETMHKIKNIALNPIWIPDSFRNHPGLFYSMLAAVPLLFILPIRWNLVLLLVGIAIGYILGVPSGTNFKDDGSTLSNWMTELTQAMLAPLKIKSKEHHDYVKLNISPAIDTELDIFLNAVLREVVDAWFVPLCMSGERDFQACLRSVVNACIMNLLRYGQNLSSDNITLMIYGMTNALVVHMEEFRAFEASNLPLDKFLKSGKTIRKYHEGFLDELGHVKQIVALLLRRLLPKQEARSILVNALLKEILSGNMLVGMIDKICDPDFVNEMIAKHLGESQSKIFPLESGFDLISLKGMSSL